jgi:BMFP domain-containing protein YqiC
LKPPKPLNLLCSIHSAKTNEQIPADLQSVAEQATDRFSQLTTLQIRIFNAQPQISNDMLDFIRQVIIKTEARLPALEQSIQEIKIEWKI